MGMTSSQNMGRNEHLILKTNFRGPFDESKYDKVVVATGCFWGAEKAFWRMPGVYTTAVGYAGGYTSNPSYKEVCSGSTGHTEAVLVVWDKEKLHFTDIIRMYLQCHDPTQVNRQGNDFGTQYRTAVYYYNDEQREITEAAIASYEKTLGEKIATELKPVDTFWYAEDYHQQYLASPGARPYCSAMPRGINMENASSWLSDKFKQQAPVLDEGFWKKYGPTPHCVIRDPHDQIKWP